MTNLLHLLPPLVVGCLLLLQSLQPIAYGGVALAHSPSHEQLDKNEADKTCDLDRELTKVNEKRKEADKQLFKTCPPEHLKKHLPFKYTVTNRNAYYLKTLCQKGYVIIYSTRRKIPLFTAERLDGAVLKAHTKALKSCSSMFRPDIRLDPDERSNLDYSKSVYTRGHLAAAGNHNKELVRLRNTYILSNIAPQYELHNKKAWEKWEEYTRTKAKKIEGFLFVITGVTGDKKKEENIQDFIVPEYWYKLLVWCENSALQAEYICAEHENKIDPETVWYSTKTTESVVNGVKATPETVQVVKQLIQEDTNISFDIINSGICLPWPLNLLMHMFKKIQSLVALRVG